MINPSKEGLVVLVSEEFEFAGFISFLNDMIPNFSTPRILANMVANK